MAGSYRDAGSYLYKGVSPRAFVHAFRGYPINEQWSKEANCLPYQIVIGTQPLHAVGLAMAAKIKGENSIAVGMCGDGATSEGDFNEALNFAGVFKAPIVLVVVNNGWAISVPRSLQTAAKTIASRGTGFGMPGYQVDGNDVLAVYQMMSQAAQRARSGEGPTLLECITYRTGAHTTADDPTRYVPRADLEYWKERDPIARFRAYLFERQLLDEAGEKEMVAGIEREIAEVVHADEAVPVPTPDYTFELAFQELTPRLQKQREEMRREMQFLKTRSENHQEKGAH
jgi:pyruvate dehydrogenase E1 component alpha subunit